MFFRPLQKIAVRREIAFEIKRRLVELEFVLQIFAHPRHDQRMGVGGDDLGEPADPRAALPGGGCRRGAHAARRWGAGKLRHARRVPARALAAARRHRHADS